LKAKNLWTAAVATATRTGTPQSTLGKPFVEIHEYGEKPLRFCLELAFPPGSRNRGKERGRHYPQPKTNFRQGGGGNGFTPRQKISIHTPSFFAFYYILCHELRGVTR
jgi:hypothetical protein